MLDLAFGLTQTSRLGCQLVAEKELDGIVVRLPSVRAVARRGRGVREAALRCGGEAAGAKRRLRIRAPTPCCAFS